MQQDYGVREFDDVSELTSLRDLQLSKSGNTEAGQKSVIKQRKCLRIDGDLQFKSGDIGAGQKSVEGDFQLMKSGDIEAGQSSVLKSRKFPGISGLMTKICITVCVISSLFLDPLFLYIPVLDRQQNCIGLDTNMAIGASALRSVFDMLFVAHIMFHYYNVNYFTLVSQCFKEGYKALSKEKKVFFRRTLCLLVDLLAIIPIPQVVLVSRLSSANVTKNTLQWGIFCQFLFRFGRIYLIYRDMGWISGTFFKNARARAALNLLVYLAVCHFVGSLYYSFSLERVETCWRDACVASQCNLENLYCDTHKKVNNQFINGACDLTVTSNHTPKFDFGIFNDALKSGVLEQTNFKKKFIYCFWWSFRNLCSFGQGLNTSSFELEICFSIFIGILGLILFAWIISKIQDYLQSSFKKREDMRKKKQDWEDWMKNLKLSPRLRSMIRKHIQHELQKTRGLDDALMLQRLSKNLIRQSKRESGFKLLTKVPLFRNIMDQHFFNTICDHLKIIWHPQNSIIWQKGDEVDEVLFVSKGALKKSFVFSERDEVKTSYISKGGCCGEELIKMYLDSSSSKGSTSCRSACTVTTVSEVKVFSLGADDLAFIMSKYPQLFNRQIKDALRSNSDPFTKSSSTKEDYVYKAKLAGKAERYEEMVEFMEKVVDVDTDELTVEERNLLSVAYENVICARRESWRNLSSIEQKDEVRGNEDHVTAIRERRSKIEKEVSSICDGILKLLDEKLIPSAGSGDSKVFYLKMKGDYHWYLLEFKAGPERKEAAESTLSAYKAAQDIANAELAPTHPIRLGLALDFSVFYYEILNSPNRACSLAKQAFDEASAELDTLGEESYKDITSIMQRLTLWTSDMLQIVTVP